MGKEYTEIGVIVKPHGLKGDVVLTVEPTVEAILADVKSVFLNLNGSYVPYLVDSVAPLNKGKAKIKMTGLDDSNEANAYRGKYLFQLSSLLNFDKQFDLEGFKVVAANGEEIGVILSVIDSTAQTLLEVQRGEDEIYIPLVEEFILETDVGKKTLKMNLPEGMLDL